MHATPNRKVNYRVAGSGYALIDRYASFKQHSTVGVASLRALRAGPGRSNFESGPGYACFRTVGVVRCGKSGGLMRVIRQGSIN
jgi:hypothetical protein